MGCLYSVVIALKEAERKEWAIFKLRLKDENSLAVGRAGAGNWGSWPWGGKSVWWLWEAEAATVTGARSQLSFKEFGFYSKSNGNSLESKATTTTKILWFMLLIFGQLVPGYLNKLWYICTTESLVVILNDSSDLHGHGRICIAYCGMKEVVTDGHT